MGHINFEGGQNGQNLPSLKVISNK